MVAISLKGALAPIPIYYLNFLQKLFATTFKSWMVAISLKGALAPIPISIILIFYKNYLPRLLSRGW